MADVKIIIGTITYTMKAKKVLNEQGITAYVAKYDGTNHQGCSYGLKIKQEEYINAVGILNEHGIRFHTWQSKDDHLPR